MCSTDLRFRVLGPVEIKTAGTVRGLPRRRERCLLAVLLLELNRMVPVDRLADLLWDGDPPERARQILQGHVSRIRTLLAEVGAAAHGVDLTTVGRGYRLSANPTIVDAHQFHMLVEEAGRIADVADRVDRLRSALDLWRGRALENAANDRLQQRLCAGLEEQRLVAIEDLMSDSLTLRQERMILPQLARVAAEHPGRERLVALHMRALYQAGRKVEALEVYTRARTHLAEQYGLDPGPQLRGMHEAILRDQLTVPEAQSPPAADQLPAPTTGEVASPTPETAGRVVPRQLPADLTTFIGREKELDQLDAPASGADSPGSELVIAAIDGMGGIGKTALAVHAAHRLADRFPDGQLFIDLKGFTERQAPVEPAEALQRLLVALGVPGQQIPSELEDRAGLRRSALAGRRMLIVLDNAATAAQVTPLLPGAPGCLVMVTSRRRLAGLSADTREVSLDMLPAADAVTLFTRVAGPDRTADEPDGLAAELVELCWRLPLAVSIAASLLRSHPAWTLADLIDRLRDGHQRLAELADGPRSVRVVLQASYQHLATDLQRFYRLLGLHPGPDIDAYAAGALAGTTPGQARRLLDRLLDERLLQEPAPGRYAFHDLVRGHATDTATTAEPEPARTAAVGRLLDYYGAPQQPRSVSRTRTIGTTSPDSQP
jgi:DNA-binding SARP family transcriptional activator